MSKSAVQIGLSAVMVSIQDNEPRVLSVRGARHDFIEDVASKAQFSDLDALPFGPFDPVSHRTLEIGLRSWVEEQTPLEPGYVEQLYTFGNKGRYAGQKEDGLRVVSVGYLALVYDDGLQADDQVFWGKWYDYFPWEDWRLGRPEIIDTVIAPALKKWVDVANSPSEKEQRDIRAKRCFGLAGLSWDDEQVLKRYELLYEAHLTEETLRDKNINITDKHQLIPSRSMKYDHRRILATAMTRIRGKIKYRPVVFELMPDRFTLLELQRAVESIGGQLLHKQNFRRLIENSGLVEETGHVSTRSGGRPANLFKYREEVLQERWAPGVKMSPVKSAS